MRIFFILFCCLNFVSCCYQHQENPDRQSNSTLFQQTLTESELQAFETKIIAFKYSLYPDLIKLQIEDYRYLESETGKNLISKVEAFLAKHKQEIKAYRQKQLLALGRFQIDLAPFEEVDLQKPFPNDYLQAPMQILLEPTGHMLAAINLILSQQEQMTAIDMGQYYLAMQIGGTRLEVKQHNPDQLEILMDTYLRVFRFDYDLNTGRVKLKNFYRRKSLNSKTLPK
jgi:hypothetical protein